MNRIYISGPMTGIPDFNHPAFHAEAARLRALGYDVINPAEINTDPTAPWHECLKKDLMALLQCDTVAVLPGGEWSRGVRLELQVAGQLQIDIVLAADIQHPPRSEIRHHNPIIRPYIFRELGNKEKS